MCLRSDVSQVSGGFFQIAQTWANAALCRSYSSLELVSPLQVTHLHPVWDRLLVSLPKDTGKCGVNEIAYVSKWR